MNCSTPNTPLFFVAGFDRPVMFYGSIIIVISNKRKWCGDGGAIHGRVPIHARPHFSQVTVIPDEKFRGAYE